VATTFAAARTIWLFEKQRGTCYLQTTDDCRDRSGRMVIQFRRRHGEQTPRDLATREHVLPRSHETGKGRALLLLACYGCNHAKGSDLSATPEQIALAERYWQEWHALSARLSGASIDVGAAVNEWLVAHGHPATMHSTRYPNRPALPPPRNVLRFPERRRSIIAAGLRALADRIDGLSR